MRKKTRISDYRHRITLQNRTTVKDDEGLETENYSDFVTVWAAFEPIKGREYFGAATVNAESTVRFRIRYRSGITPDMRVVYDNRTFNITSPPIDVDGQHKEIHLMCVEVWPDGT